MESVLMVKYKYKYKYKYKMFDISGLVTSASKIAMLSTNKAN